MTRIAGVPESSANPLVRLTYRLTRRQLGRMVDGIAVYAHRPKLMAGYGALEKAVESEQRVDPVIRMLVVLKAAALQTCEFCIDIGSHKAREAGISERQLRELHRYRDSEHFDAVQRLALDLAVAMTRTPVVVSDELFDALREHFDDGQLVELVNLIAVENLRGRFNTAFAIDPAGFSDGMVCARPEPQGAESLAAAG
jgi:4-carboxymuconolactone decarboxylase